MEYKKFGSRYIIRIDRDEEIVANLEKVCKQENITLGNISGIGAADKTIIGVYDVEKQELITQEFTGTHEISNLSGNVSEMNDQTYLHLHACIGGPDLKAYAGHLKEAVVGGTCEVIIDSFEGHIDREKDEEVTGLNLIKF